jgi:signal transduction histidine kinase
MKQRLPLRDVKETQYLDSAVRQASLLVRADASAFYLCDPACEQFELAAAHGLQEVPWGEDLVRQAARSRQAVISPSHESPALIAVPSLWHDTLRGVLVVADNTPRRTFDHHDSALLQPLAELTAAAMSQAERLTRMTAQFRALHVIDIALTSSLQLDRVLNLILEKATGLVGAEHGSLRLLDPETGVLVLKAHLGEGWTQEVCAYTFRLGHGITGWVAQHQKPYLCSDALNDPLNVVLFEEMRSGVAVPLLEGLGPDQVPDQVQGVLLLESTRPAAFDQQDVELLEALAQVAMIAIQNATQHHQLQSMHDALHDEHERRVAAEKWAVMGQAATALAHRINNLVGLVPASAAEIRRTLTGLELPRTESEWIEANLQRIERSGRFILRMADALFRPFQETGPLARFDVNRLLQEALRAADPPSDVRLVRDFGHDLPAVESSSLLVDVFLELFINALKAMQDCPRKQLQVSTRSDLDEAGAWVVIQIADTGPGITPHTADRLWEMFKQSEDGVGFGLWWVRTFIERQGGSISFDSKLGEGTTFAIRLPASLELEPNES